MSANLLVEFAVIRVGLRCRILQNPLRVMGNGDRSLGLERQWPRQFGLGLDEQAFDIDLLLEQRDLGVDIGDFGDDQLVVALRRARASATPHAARRFSSAKPRMLSACCVHLRSAPSSAARNSSSFVASSASLFLQSCKASNVDSSR